MIRYYPGGEQSLYEAAELLKNARDAALQVQGRRPRIHVYLSREALVVANDGVFTRQGLNVILGGAQLAKASRKGAFPLIGRADPLRLGGQGVGFKAALRLTDSPEIHARFAGGVLSLRFGAPCLEAGSAGVTSEA